MRAWIALLWMTGGLLAGDADFNGRWNLTVKNERNRMWWLEVQGAGTGKLTGSFVGAPGGQVDAIEEMQLHQGELKYVFRREAAGGKKTVLTYRAKVEGDRLTGSMVSQTEGMAPLPPVPFTGARAPAIADQDDGSWKEGKPVAVFNGRNLDGWRLLVAGRPGWKVENGILRNESKASDMVSDAKFWNFVLRAEYRYEKGSNSGIALRGRYELQIYDNYGQPPDGHGNGALYSRIAPASNASKAPGEWQQVEARLVGRTLTVKLNGVTVIDHKEVVGPTAMVMDPNEGVAGPIALQGDHGLVEFRKLEVIPLTR